MVKKKGFMMLVVFMFMMSVTNAVFADNHEESADIVDTAVDAGNFTTLVAAVEQAGLVDALKGEGPFTVFAPTDEAFANLLEELDVTAEELLAREDLADILQYHVVSGKVMASDLEDGMEAETLNGQKVMISLDPVQVNDANVTTADIETSNGVIHVIDGVLLPMDEETESIPETGQSSVLPYVGITLLAAIIGIYFYRRERTAKA
ncbi:fasciclin domain-containing protein [Aquibacillus koreensis]|uniref:Fasciclin domain-containing protein n=1 Tax=Aquibacillus koreensis TaxID=279446 RepID=A0A9X4AIZ8_9BACI|nr:fasciclin domain-containing protein [Aquibacillus koreensis]MCT2537082.1 fasciclin domain-containing protein [Aquibacillus koreensis]MDC3419935.1 fasciclin domain-containing protein [Aquibacillus koreensis]